MKNKFFLICFAMIAYFSLNAMTLEEAKQIALKNNLELQTELNALNSSKWDLYSSRFDLLPSVSVKSSYSNFDPEIRASNNMLENEKSYSFNVNFPIFIGGKNFLSSQIKSDVYKISEYSYQSKKLEVSNTVEIKYLKVLETQKLLSISEKDYQSALNHEEIAQIRFSNNSISNADYLNFKSQSANKKVRLLQAKNAFELSLHDLKSYLNIDDAGILEQVEESQITTLAEYFGSIDIETLDNIQKQLIKYSEKSNLSLGINKLSVESIKKSHLMSMGNFLPSLNLNYVKEWSKANYDSDFSDQSTLILSASIPLFPIMDDYSNTMKSHYSVKKAELQYQNVQNSIELAVKSSFLNFISSLQSYEASKLSLQYSEESWLQKEIRFKNNLLSANEMIDADILINNARIQYTTSIYNVLKAKSSLMQILNIEEESKLMRLIKE